MVRTRDRVVFDGVAKLRIIAEPDGKIRICAEVDRQNASDLKMAISMFVGDLSGADSADLTKMVEEMRQV